ncbi:MAG TPA: helix-turn-helix transcriptional regulator [Hyphomicrobiaceae bacterium]
MIKRNLSKPREDVAECGVGGAVWTAVGSRLQQRRGELGLSVARVAQWAAIPAESYEAYERGAPIPAALLAQIAELFEVPLVWFFERVRPDGREEVEAREDAARDPEPAVYRVATVEHRIQALAESFRKLDFEGQQHLIAISQALTRSNAGAARD